MPALCSDAEVHVVEVQRVVAERDVDALAGTRLNVFRWSGRRRIG
jgi:hypothetical protein